MKYQQKLLMILCAWSHYGVSSQRPVSLKLELLKQEEKEGDFPATALDIEALQQKDSDSFEQKMQDRSLRTKKWDRLQRKIFQSSTKAELEELAQTLLEFKEKNFDTCLVGALCDDGDADTPSKTYWDPVVLAYNEQAKKLGAKELSLWDKHADEARSSTSMSLSITDTASVLDKSNDLSGLQRLGLVNVHADRDRYSPFSMSMSSSVSPMISVLGAEYVRLQDEISALTAKQQLGVEEVRSLGVALHKHRKKAESRHLISELIYQYHNQVVRRLRTSFASRLEFQMFAESLPQPGETDSACVTPRLQQSSSGSPFEGRTSLGQ